MKTNSIKLNPKNPRKIMIIEKKKISDLKPAPYNPRKSSDKQEANLKKSLEKFGVVEPIVFNKQTGHIVGGHFRIRELKKLGYKEVDCVIVDLNEDDEKELNIRLNANTGEWDFDILVNEWDIEQLKGWGLELEWDKKTKQEAEEDGFEGGKDIQTDIQVGDMFKIGEHILLCGDATKEADVNKLMGGEKADMIFTDPPYEIESVDIYLTIKQISENSNILIWASDKQIPFIFDAKIGEFKRLYTIDTGIASPTNNDVYVNHIAILRFKVGNATKFNNVHDGGRSIIKTEYRKNLKEEKLHNHQKSLKTLGLFIEYWSNKKQLVVDIFGGSGSTMAACEQLNRKCYMMELDPKNCQIILDRMKKCYNLDAIKLN